MTSVPTASYLRRVAAIGLVYVVSCSLIIGISIVRTKSDHAVAAPVPVPGLPTRFAIPVLGVDAEIEHLGLLPDGSMSAPKGPDNVAWFDAGPRPGAEGSAVIDGHYGWTGGRAAVFDTLHTLKKGDLIFVTDDIGTKHIFAVRELRAFDQGGDASEVFSSNDGKAHLNLITCEGTWDDIAQDYSSRLVVFADAE